MRNAALSALLLLAACASRPVDPSAACAALNAPIPVGAIGLPTGGATIESAKSARAARLKDLSIGAGA